MKSSSRYSLLRILPCELDHTNPKLLQTWHFLSFLCENELLLQSHANFARPHLPKALRTRQFFNAFYVKLSSRYSLVHILPTSSSKKCSEHVSFFLNIFIWNQVPVHILPIFQKCSEHDSFQHFRMQICKSRSRYSPVHCSSTTFADRGLEPRKQRPYFGDHGSHFTRKKHTVSRPRWIQAFPGVTSQLLDDDVVDMML